MATLVGFSKAIHVGAGAVGRCGPGVQSVPDPDPPGTCITDSFQRTVSNGWGTSDVLIAWTLNASGGLDNAGNEDCFSVNESGGVINGNPALVHSGNPFICLPLPLGFVFPAPCTVSWDWDTAHVNGSEPQFYLVNAANTALFYGADLYFDSGTGQPFLGAFGVDSSGFEDGDNVTPPGVTMGGVVHMKMQLIGRQVSLKAWSAGGEPGSWQVSAGDPGSAPPHTLDVAYFYLGFLDPGVLTTVSNLDIETLNLCP